MPERRQDPTTKEWVVIALERAKRPDQFHKRTSTEAKPAPEDRLCAFCPGNELLTPEEVFALRDSGMKNEPGWRVRVVPNKFAAFTPKGSVQHPEYGRFFNAAGAFGHHEVIIESSEHNQIFPLMNEQQIQEILYAYCQRYEALRKDPRVKLILFFRNHGPRAGTSLAHPHSQLVATPIIPLHIRQKYEVAIRHYDDTGRCIYCDVVNEEKAAGKRVVLETPRFLVFHPFASQVPFESWIAPKRHEPSFARTSFEERFELASVLHRVVRGLHDALDNPDFNLIIHTAPLEDEDKPYFLWHLEIHPRLTIEAGFELGTGISINTAIPEETATFLKSKLAEMPAREPINHA